MPFCVVQNKILKPGTASMASASGVYGRSYQNSTASMDVGTGFSLPFTHSNTEYKYSWLVLLRTTETTSGDYFFSIGKSTGGAGYFGLRGAGSATSIQIAWGGGTNETYSSVPNWADGNVHAIAVSTESILFVDGYRYNVYIDGQLVATRTSAVNDIAGYNEIGLGGLTRGSLSSPTACEIFGLTVWEKALYEQEIAEISRNPWQIFRKRPQILYFDAATGGATDLTIADSTHSHSADNTVLTSSHLLTVADATHAHSADNISLSTAILLAISEALHGHTADNLTLTLSGSENLVIADASHGHTADNLSLTALSVLVVAEALHSHLADNVVLSLAGSENLVIADAAHAHSADNLSLTSQLALSIAEAAHAHTADGVVITSQHVLAVADALHAHAADNLTLSDAPSLNIAEASHGHSADNLALTSASLLAIADAAHAHLADNVELTSAHMLAIIEAMHAHAADNVVLSLIAVRAVELLTAAARDTQLTAAARDTTLESRHAVHG
jgi:hypothetical protein